MDVAKFDLARHLSETEVGQTRIQRVYEGVLV